MIRVIKALDDLRVVICPRCGHTLEYENPDVSTVQTEIVPENLIVIDFDIKDENGNKSFGEYKYKNEIVCPICSTHIFVK